LRSASSSGVNFERSAGDIPFQRIVVAECASVEAAKHFYHMAIVKGAS